MKQAHGSTVRKLLLPLATAGVAVGAFLGLPAMKALAQEWKILPRAVQPPTARLNLVRPPHVNPTAARLVAIADEAFSDGSLAERIFQDPDAVAAQYNLSEHEKLVLSKMTRDQFETARGDADRISQARLAQAGPNILPADATDARLIAGRMVVGRAILAAVGRSYLDAANAHGCCPWGHAIELGVNPSRVFYNEVFQARPLNIRQLDLPAPRSN